MSYSNGRSNGQNPPSRLSQKQVKGPDCDGLKLWNDVCETDPAFTKEFKGKGGFAGTAIHPMYNLRKASEIFSGPCGSTWGFIETETRIEDGSPSVMDGHLVFEKIWFSKVTMWYTWTIGGKPARVEVSQWGATTMVFRGKEGWKSDEEAAKKSFTDACSKCLSMLGFGADIHMGMYDDNKYVNNLRARLAEEAERQNGGGQDDENRQGDRNNSQQQERPQSHQQPSQGQGNGQRQQDQGGQQAPSTHGGIQMSDTLQKLLMAINEGCLVAEGVALVEELARISMKEANIGAFALLKARIDSAATLKHLEILARRQDQFCKAGYLSEQQDKELNKIGSAKAVLLGANQAA